LAKLTSIHSTFTTRLCLALLPCLLLLSSTQNVRGQASATEPQTFTYRTVGTHELKAYVFLPPSGTKPAGKARPAILLFHGGAWQLGDATWMFGRAKEFAANGIVAIAIDYRLANDGLTPIESVEDATQAFTWTRSQANKFGIDPQRVAGYGVSAGGHLVAAAATLPAVNGKQLTSTSRPNAMLLYSPALDMAKDPYFTRIMLGKADPALYSPSEFITRTLPPTLIIQGEKDTIVFADAATAFCKKAEAAGARCELHLYPGVGHLLTRNLKVQYKDFDSDPTDAADAHRREDDFLISLGYMHK
jgi:acetyl esterase